MRLARRKALALVAYLAMADTPLSRDELATMLWPELSQERARGALRATLPSLTGAVATAWIEANRRTISLHREGVAVDAARFLALVAAARAHHQAGEAVCPACIARLREADGLYGGDFLQGFSLPDNPDFENWQLARREALRHELAWALQALAAHSWRSVPQPDESALGYGRRLVELDPLNEASHRLLIELYAAAGRRAEAMRQYQRCAALLHDELNVDPAPATTALYERIASVEPAGPQQPDPQPPALPAEPGSFVGREAELDWIVATFAGPDCRLLTLTGPGGIGKTRLALRAAALLAPRFAHGASIVALDEAYTTVEALNLMATALGIMTPGGESPLNLVRAALARRVTLLVLDNLEQIDGVADLLLTLLTAAPGLAILATSRERIGLRAEHLLTLEGLPFGGARQGTEWSAVRLFAERARQVNPAFVLEATNRPAVEQICALVDGMPLALELAAAWARTLTPHEIAGEIARSPDFLRTTVRDLPERQRSLRAVFAHSWRLLSAHEQAVYGRLAVFRGGFTAEAARAVAAAELDDLLGFVDQSLLRRGSDGRFTFHPLLQQYAAEQLAELPAELAAIQGRHCRFIAAIIANRGPELRGGNQQGALAAMVPEGPNMRAAWGWAVQAGDYASMASMLDGLAQFCELRSYRREGEAALAAAEARLAADAATDRAIALLLARVQAWRGHFCQFLGRYDDADLALAGALAAAQALDEQALVAFCYKGQGINANARGDHRQALALHGASLAIYQAIGDQSGLGEALNRMGGAAYDMGDLAAADSHWRASLAAYTARDDPNGMGRALNNLGEVARIAGRYAEARRLAERSLAVQVQLGRAWTISPLNNLGMIARLEGRYAEARQIHTRSLALCDEVGDARGTANTTLYLAELDLATGDLAQAETGLAACLAAFRALGQRQGVCAALRGLAELALAQGAHAEAAVLARESLFLAENIPARLAAGRALATLGRAMAGAGDLVAAEAAFARAEQIFGAVGAAPEAAAAAAERRGVAP